MAGIIIPLFSRRTFTFTGLQSGQEMEFVMVKELDVTAYREGLIQVRVHSATFGSGSSYIECIARETMPSPEDPSVDFVGASDLVSVRVGTASSPPALEYGSLGTNFGAYIQLVVLGHRASTDTVTAALSADLVLKD